VTDLRSPLDIRGMRLRNRIVFPPVTCNYGTTDGNVTDDLIGFYKLRTGGIGLVIVEATAVRPDGRLVPGSLGLWGESHLEGLKHLVETIHAGGAAAAIQLVHGGARSFPSEGDMLGASPSGYAFRPDVRPFVMEQGDIERVTEDFATAAQRAAAAGFDAVEIHGAHLYLISQFLSPLTNTRGDRYGGGPEGRAQFPAGIVKAVRSRLGPAAPLIFRLNAVENVEGGQTLGDAIAVSHSLVAAGVDILHVSLVAQSSWREIDGRRFLVASSALPKDAPAGANAANAAAIRTATGAPVIAVGKLGEPGAAAWVIAEELADLAAIGRQMIADPDTALKILDGRDAEIVRCRQCYACYASIFRGQPMTCSVNPTPWRHGSAERA